MSLEHDQENLSNKLLRRRKQRENRKDKKDKNKENIFVAIVRFCVSAAKFDIPKNATSGNVILRLIIGGAIWILSIKSALIVTEYGPKNSDKEAPTVHDNKNDTSSSTSYTIIITPTISSTPAPTIDITVTPTPTPTSSDVFLPTGQVQ